MRILLLASGFTFTGLGVLGIFIPLLPTTPFLLLAAACFARSSERFHFWLMNNRWLGPYIKNYRDKRGITVKHKIITLSVLWITIIFSILYATPLLWVRLFLLMVAVGVTYHLGTLKSIRS